MATEIKLRVSLQHLLQYLISVWVQTELSVKAQPVIDKFC